MGSNPTPGTAMRIADEAEKWPKEVLAPEAKLTLPYLELSLDYVKTLKPKPTISEGNMRNPEVDAWFEKKQHPLEDAMQAVREVALAADPRITESIKWSTPTYSYQGNIFSFNPAKRFVSLLFHTGAQIPGTHPGLEGEGETARVMRFEDVDDVSRRSAQLTEVLQEWCRWKDE